MFMTHKQAAKCVNYNATAEKLGKKDFRPVGDVKFRIVVPNTVLDEFGPDYRTFLYSRANARRVTRDKDAPDQHELVPAPDDGLTELKHQNLKPLELSEKFTGYGMTVSSELELSEPLDFDDVTLTGFVFKAMPGGSLQITFRARVTELSPEDSGDLHFLSRKDVLLTLVPPAAAPRQVDIEDEAEAA